jgi:hypothetical protein
MTEWAGRLAAVVTKMMRGQNTALRLCVFARKQPGEHETLVAVVTFYNTVTTVTLVTQKI